MNKNIASAIVNKHLNSQLLNPNNGGNVTWANINASKDVWWADIPVKKFAKTLYLILNDDRNSTFSLLSIDNGKIKYPYNHFKKLREGYISIEISSRDRDKFIDLKSGGTNFNFSNFLTKTFDYSNLNKLTKQTNKTTKTQSQNNNPKTTELDSSSVISLQSKMSGLFKQLSMLQENIKKELKKHCDNKTLKGNEVVGWLGEIYGKILFNGNMVDDSYEHDIETIDGKRISIKTRKGWKSGWTQSSAIPKIKGDNCPTHLLFVHLDDDYSINGMWLFPWDFLVVNDRFRKHMVRGNLRSYIFHLNESKDSDSKIFP